MRENWGRPRRGWSPPRFNIFIVLALVQRHDLTFEEGTLSIFSGRRSLHRVTDCYGDLDRLVAVFTFSQEKNYKNSIEVRKLFWGRSGEEDVSSSVSSKL